VTASRRPSTTCSSSAVGKSCGTGRAATCCRIRRCGAVPRRPGWRPGRAMSPAFVPRAETHDALWQSRLPQRLSGSPGKVGRHRPGRPPFRVGEAPLQQRRIRQHVAAPPRLQQLVRPQLLEHVVDGLRRRRHELGDLQLGQPLHPQPDAVGRLAGGLSPAQQLLGHPHRHLERGVQPLRWSAWNSRLLNTSVTWAASDGWSRSRVRKVCASTCSATPGVRRSRRRCAAGPPSRPSPPSARRAVEAENGVGAVGAVQHDLDLAGPISSTSSLGAPSAISTSPRRNGLGRPEFRSRLRT